jgi:hypothetical protein
LKGEKLMATKQPAAVGTKFWEKHLPNVKITLDNILAEYLGGIGNFQQNGEPFYPDMEMEVPNIVLTPAAPDSQIAVCLSPEGDWFNLYLNKGNGRWHKEKLVFHFLLRDSIVECLNNHFPFWKRHSTQVQVILYDILRKYLGSRGSIQPNGAPLFEGMYLREPNFVLTPKSFPDLRVAVCLNPNGNSFDIRINVSKGTTQSEFNIPPDKLRESIENALRPGELEI